MRWQTYADDRSIVRCRRFGISPSTRFGGYQLSILVVRSVRQRMYQAYSSPVNFTNLGMLTHRQPQPSTFVLVTTSTWLTYDILASASPLNPYVTKLCRSENSRNLDVAYRVQSSGRSALLIPWPLSAIWMSLSPPSLSVTRMEVEPASREFSISSLMALAGRWMIFAYQPMIPPRGREL